MKTVTEAVPTAAISEARIAAVNCVADPYVVVRFDPFQRTTEPFTKFVPFTVSVKAAPPAVAELGTNPLVVGIGLVELPPSGVFISFCISVWLKARL